MEDRLIDADNRGSGGPSLQDLHLQLLEHLIVLQLEVGLIWAPPAPANLDLLVADFVLLVKSLE